MSKTAVQTKKQQEQQATQVIRLRANKEAEQQPNAVVENEDMDDTEEFYVGVFTKMKNIIDELDDRNNIATKKVTAYQRALDIREQEHRKKEQHLNDALKDKESQIKLMNQEVDYYRNKDNASKNTRKNVTDMVSQLYEIKENKNKKKVEEGVDDMVDDILKKYRT
ncbi:hypothetical protein Klosneuvirus_11_11 [Klosneuvirus KNV1]|uniref:Uncharacterized protein n=1 Tax=Klosneuvirus KNV1 TaxID=1977640 RepID=A0A1V0SLN8_9VIRU|nr:hypothetical protein Klosneuvirus_11_11 [Klosneuvirus KNV1]